ncbi:LacI family transcriptional regulator [Clostridia bacterium]|nr:LacI family transcriptional regulator [Clostridia bacterium]
MTLKEIAEKANVSISTVSRIINSADDNFARKEVRDRVWSIIRETGYLPNQSARELRKNEKLDGEKIHTLACVFGRTRNAEDNPFFAQVARAAEQQALRLGYVVTMSYSVFDIDNNASAQRFGGVKTDGALILGRFDRDMFKFFERYYKNIVFVGRNPIDAKWDQVICDGYAAAKTALEHLISYGHRRIAYIGETQNEVRYSAYLDAVAEHGLEHSATLTASFAQNSAGGYAGACFLLENAKPLPTAVFCAADVMAIAAIKRFSEKGVPVPSEISVIGMDDIELAGFVSPMLTTVRIPKVELGNVAARTLIDRINKVHKLPMKIFIPHELIRRESVGAGYIVDIGSGI